MLSLGGPEMGLAVLEVARGSNNFQTWKRALSAVEIPDRAIMLAKEHGQERLLPRR